ncbi:hypothetical protein M422DRAFT_269772 [Sphaerobolus stellatus SS14]|uniref:Uncharacterized protein n=1 Tax=Sphaerobolus stellatus (strain SS14) TaxID=990650 RepID=A0A0C9UUS7_SPHS4|nr:hypothetical protein M422DRAFT_269772 [Sphaerobolus stellatus SS14]
MSKPSGSLPGRSASGNSDNDEYVGRGTCSCTQKRFASSSDSKEDKKELQEERLRQINMADWYNDIVGTHNMKFMDIKLDFV